VPRSQGRAIQLGLRQTTPWTLPNEWLDVKRAGVGSHRPKRAESIRRPQRVSIYITGNDGITCARAAAHREKGEVLLPREAVARRPDQAATLLACGNALPGVEKQTKVGDRDT